MSLKNWEADKMFDVYVHDYLVKRNFKASAEAFQSEANVLSDPVVIDAPGSFLFEWWSVFWDIYIARNDEKRSEAAASYVETQKLKAGEQQNAYQQILMRQGHQQQQEQREAGHLINGSADTISGNVSLMRQDPGNVNAFNTELYERALKPPPTQLKPFMPGPQPFPQLQMLTPQQRHLLFLAQQSSNSTSSGDVESRRLRMLLSGPDLSMVRDGMLNSVGEAVPIMGSPMQGGTNMLYRDPVMFMQHQQQLQQQSKNQSHQIHHQQQPISSHQPQSSNPNIHQDKSIAIGNVVGDGGRSSSFPGNDQSSKNQTGRKRKHLPLSGPTNSSGTANTAGPSTSAPSTPSTHPPGDVRPIPSLSQGATLIAPDNAGTMKPSTNQFDLEKGEKNRFVDDVEDNVLSFFDDEPQDPAGHMNVSQGFSFTELCSVSASANKVMTCHFSSDGKLLASGGHDKKAVLWNTDGLKAKATLDEHSSYITGVRFSPNGSCLATSSFDKTVRVWDVDNPGYSLRAFTGHSGGVISLDFHPNKEDLISSCDADGEIRYWNITNGSCTAVFKGGSAQVRFQPHLGRYLAAAGDNIVSILDAETQTCLHSLKGHMKPVRNICWDNSGDLLASLSEDSVKVWTLRSGTAGECVHQVNCCNGNKFHSCIFHPTCPSILIIGCYQSMELWNMAEDAMLNIPAHSGLIESLAASTATGLVASAGHDKVVKLWK